MYVCIIGIHNLVRETTQLLQHILFSSHIALHSLIPKKAKLPFLRQQFNGDVLLMYLHTILCLGIYYFTTIHLHTNNELNWTEDNHKKSQCVWYYSLFCRHILSYTHF